MAQKGATFAVANARGTSGRPRGGDRKAFALMPLRQVTNGSQNPSVLECGHRLPNPYRNGNKQRHCPECPRLPEPVSEVARLRLRCAELKSDLRQAREMLSSALGDTWVILQTNPEGKPERELNETRLAYQNGRTFETYLTQLLEPHERTNP